MQLLELTLCKELDIVLEYQFHFDVFIVNER
jgi:hypothetical protein